MRKLIRIFLLIVVLSIFSNQGAVAVCNNNPPECGGAVGGCSPSTDQCGDGCCVAPGSGGGTTGGGGVFVCHHSPVDCPAGTTRTSTVVSSVCTNERKACNLGTAEQLAGACEVVLGPDGEIITAAFLVNTYSCVARPVCPAACTGCATVGAVMVGNVGIVKWS